MQSHLASVPKRRDAERTAELEDRIRTQLEAHNAVIVAHYYTAPEIRLWLRRPVAVYRTRWRWLALDETTGRYAYCRGCAIHGRDGKDLDA